LVKTWWREAPDEAALKDSGLEVLLPQAAELTELPARLIAPGVLPGLWEKPEITVGELCKYFSGGKVVQVQKEGYQEPVAVPRAERAVVEVAVATAVRGGTLWLTSGPASVLAEEVPAGVMTDDAVVQAPPQPIPTSDILPENLPEAWRDGTTTALGICTAVSRRVGKTLPWAIVRAAIDGAVRTQQLECTTDSGPWPCEFAGAQNVKLRLPSAPPRPERPTPPKPGTRVAEADLRPNEIQDLADQIGEITKAAVGLDLRFHLRVEITGDAEIPEDTISAINVLLREVSEDLRLQ
jgi:hypothetical protein